MRRVATALVFIGLLNFVAFLVGTFVVGGDAVNGDSSCPAGHHYLWDKSRPIPCHQVSDSVYRYSKIHTYSVLVSWPFIIVAGIWLNRRSGVGRAIRRVGALPTHKRYQAWMQLLRRAKATPRGASRDEDINRIVDEVLEEFDSGQERK